SIITSTTRTAPWDTVHHGNFCAVGYHNPKREKVSGPMGSNPLTVISPGFIHEQIVRDLRHLLTLMSQAPP
ncbi:hypothetical protein, partial [Aeromonas caviae]|uniref:hypothetical protein n=1 Tax=Aeromonas caviae TaxID=648 RepID=UPI0038D1591C